MMNKLQYVKLFNKVENSVNNYSKISCKKTQKEGNFVINQWILPENVCDKSNIQTCDSGKKCFPK